MCHRIDRKIINSPTQMANGKSTSHIPSQTTNETKNILQLLVQRIRNKLHSCRSDRDTIDGITASSNFDYKFDRNFEMRPNNNMSHREEKIQIRNWRYHLTNDHF